MKKLLLFVMAVFLITIVVYPIGCAQPPGGKGVAPSANGGDKVMAPGGAGAPAKAAGGGGEKAKPPRPKLPTHEEFMAMYDWDGDGEVTMEEFLQGSMIPEDDEKDGKK